MSPGIQAFLNFCRIEKGLSPNSIEAYGLDLKRFDSFAAAGYSGRVPDVEGVREYLDSLRDAGLGSCSIARHLTTLRGFYRFLLREEMIDSDPTSVLTSPKQWANLP